jgi:hypothetical protein
MRAKHWIVCSVAIFAGCFIQPKPSIQQLHGQDIERNQQIVNNERAQTSREQANTEQTPDALTDADLKAELAYCSAEHNFPPKDSAKCLQLEAEEAKREIEAEFWSASSLTKNQYEEDVLLLNQVTPRQWDAIRDFNAGLPPSKEDAIQVKMLSRKQLRAIVEMSKWLKWRNEWVAQKKAEIQVDADRENDEARQRAALALQWYQALEASRPITTNCYQSALGVSCVSQ